MKTVWVNRFNADGTLKPMSDWLQISVRDDTTHARVQWDEIWQVSEKGCRNIWDDSKTVCYEHIGNQRGDGWFNVEDEQPPKGVPVLVFRDPKSVKEITQDDVAIGTYWGDSEPSFGHAFELSEGGCWFLERCDTLLWQPIQPAKHLN